MELTPHQQTIFLDRYAKRDEDNTPIENNVEQMWRRVADEIAETPQEAEAFYEVLTDWRFVPGGRILAGAGTESEKTYYNCYVIPVETRARRKNKRAATDGWPAIEVDSGSDSREAIFDTIATMVDIMSRGGGVGINWSVLRPTGSYLTRISGTSSGPVGWMDVASKAVGEVIQGGSRRGAAMFMLADWHPDVEEFVDAKRIAGRIENANVSVAVSDKFMEAVRADDEWELVYPDTTHPAYNTLWEGDIRDWTSRGYPVRSFKRVRARELWRKLAEAAHASGEPGVVFLDRYNELSTGKGVEKIISVNPCGEQGLGAYSVCNLGAMNLDAYVEGGIFDYPAFEFDVGVAVRFLDNVIDKTYYHLPETREQQMKLRRIGLGVMGLADALIKLGIRYGSSEAVSFTERVFSTMKGAAVFASAQLAREKGAAPAWREEMWDRPYLEDQGAVESGMRNMFLLTQAPTGTTAALAGVNSGIEPYFALGYWREDRTGKHYVMPKTLEEWYESHTQDESYHIVTANDVTYKEHLLMQAAVQKYVDSSVSKTINAPKEQGVEDVLEAYSMAYDLGLKGLAYYRDGSRDKQVLYREDPNARIRQLEARIAELEGLVNPAYALPPKNGLDKTVMPMLSLQKSEADACPSCGGKKVYEEGCQKCLTCSWAAC
jgi:ribonucleoside-diphosphate reductase alpha chain